jgi:hypothetical protein
MDAEEKSAVEQIPPQKEVYCNRCRGDTRHECVWKSNRTEVDWDYEEGSPNLVQDWIFVAWRCLGCLSVCLEERYSDSNMYNSKGDQEWDSQISPIRTQNHLRPKYFTHLPDKIATIYKESVTAFNSSARLLCAVGLRSMIEGVCKDKKIPGKNLEDRIDGLSSILPATIVKNLHGFRFLGNTAVHDLARPMTYDLRLAIEVCEDLLNYLYELDYKTARLGKLMEARLRARKQT